MPREPTEKERFTIILENIEGKFDALKEGQEASESRLTTKFNVRFDTVEESLKEVQFGIKYLNQEVREMKSQLPFMQHVLSHHEHRIKKLETV